MTLVAVMLTVPFILRKESNSLILNMAGCIGVMGILFVDMGNAFYEKQNLFDVNEWRYGYGGGVLWFSPFGPLQVVLGFPVDPTEVEDSPVFEFSVGGFSQ